MELIELKKKALELADEMKADFEEVNKTVYDFAETAMQEYKSSAYLVEKLKSIGFKVTYPYCGIDTAFRAEFGSGSPKIAFLAEYDALPGYGPGKNINAHACGHNWIAANCYGACAVLAKLKDYFEGTIVYMGCPAEESVGGKVIMTNAGAFDDIDAAMQIHILNGDKSMLGVSSLALDFLEFTFEGVSSHSAGAPERGVNALDAAYLTFDGINALRQHTTPDTRIHGIIAEGGLAPNVVPCHCVDRINARAADRPYLNSLTKKLVNCAKGAALMTGCKLSWRYYGNSLDPLKRNRVMEKLMFDNLCTAGETPDSFCREDRPPMASSDVGNVSQVCPTVAANLAVHNEDGSHCHEEAFLAYVTGPHGFKYQNEAVKAQALTALDLFCQPQVLKAAKDEFYGKK